jgi:hypothetical protein
MSTEGRTLAGWITALLDALGAADPPALARLRRVVGSRRARIGLDGEVVDFGFVGARLVALPPSPRRRVHGTGETDRETVLDLLDGHREVTDAILDGHLRVRGETDAVSRIVNAIDILLDAAPRAPALQTLAAEFRQQCPCPPRAGPMAGAPVRCTAWSPAERPPGEDALLARHDLLPDVAASRRAAGASTGPADGW